MATIYLDWDGPQDKGRSPVTVDNWGLNLADGRRMAIRELAPWSARCPHRLEPGASASWYVLTSDVRSSCEGQGIRGRDLTAWVGPGDGAHCLCHAQAMSENHQGIYRRHVPAPGAHVPMGHRR
jgi:hypothetical protein